MISGDNPKWADTNREVFRAFDMDGFRGVRGFDINPPPLYRFHATMRWSMMIWDMVPFNDLSAANDAIQAANDA